MIRLDPKNPKGIIWIASYPRSGNTWMRAFINALQSVMKDADSADVDINRFEEASASESSAPLYPRFLGKPVFKATAAEINDVRRHAEEMFAKSNARDDACDKRLAEKDLRISKIEQDLQHIPNKDAVHRIELTIQKLQGDVEQATSQWRGVQTSIQRLEEYLVHMTVAPAATARAPRSRGK